MYIKLSKGLEFYTKHDGHLITKSYMRNSNNYRNCRLLFDVKDYLAGLPTESKSDDVTLGQNVFTRTIK